MPLFSHKTPAAGIFGKARHEVARASGLRSDPVPDCDAFEADFVSYLNRLDCSAVVCDTGLGHQRKEFTHG